MLSALIIDDEVITRKGLRTHIAWSKFGVEEIYDAGNARDALELVKEKKPDIILSDVCMPGMNGIEMCEKIRELGLKCQIVFLSGYSDKEYLKGAIMLEAVSYVEKPVDIEELEEALRQASDKCIQSKKEQEKLKKLLNENYAMVQKRLLNRLLVPHVNAKLVEHDFYKLRIDWSSMDQFVVILVRFAVMDHADEQLWKTIRKQLRTFESIGSMQETHTYVCICALEDEKLSELQETMANLRDMIAQREFYCTVGKCVEHISNVYESYQSADAAMQQLHFWKTIHMAWAAELPEENVQFDEQLLDNFEEALKQYKQERASLCCEELYEHMKAQPNAAVSSMRGTYFRFMDAIFQTAGSMLNQKRYADIETISIIWEHLLGIGSLEEYQSYLQKEVNEYFGNHEELAVSNQLILSVVAYVQSNYQNPELCLNQIAENVFLSPNYLSTTFKKKMGKTIGNYIADVRLENAKKLLKDRSLKLYDVAIQCGYKDSNYFAKLFKKSVGVTPSDYRERV